MPNGERTSQIISDLPALKNSQSFRCPADGVTSSTRDATLERGRFG
jgi:hypothetical protein